MRKRLLVFSWFVKQPKCVCCWLVWAFMAGRTRRKRVQREKWWWMTTTMAMKVITKWREEGEEEKIIDEFNLIFVCICNFGKGKCAKRDEKCCCCRFRERLTSVWPNSGRRRQRVATASAIYYRSSFYLSPCHQPSNWWKTNLELVWQFV